MQTASRGVIVNLFNHSLLLPHPGKKKITLLWTGNKVGMKLKKENAEVFWEEQTSGCYLLFFALRSRWFQEIEYL